MIGFSSTGSQRNSLWAGSGRGNQPPGGGGTRPIIVHVVADPGDHAFSLALTVFGDRAYTVITVPTAGNALLGKSWIRTAADSKNYTPISPPLATFTTGVSSIALVVDDRLNATGTTKPAFLDSTWVDQGYDLTIRETSTATRVYSVYKKAVTVGSTVTLPTINSTLAPCYFIVAQ